MNSILLIGHLPEPPQYFTTQQGADLTKFKLLTSFSREHWKGRYTNKLPEHQCIAWGPAALQLHEFLEKGSRLAVRGELFYAQYIDKFGQRRSKAEVHISDFTFLGSIQTGASLPNTIA
ncbi:MAG: single-stranded DNA-binding protein [Bacteroidota bacterium]